MNTRVLVVLFFICWAFYGRTAQACPPTVFTVGPPGSGPTIQATILGAGTGDTILVLPGTYKESINFNGKKITIKSMGTPANTIIDPTLTAGVMPAPVVYFVNFEGPDSVLTGFTIRGGSSAQGGGIQCINSSPTIDGNIIESNGALNNTPTGGGIYCMGGGPIITHNLIRNNFAVSFGGGIYCEGSAAIIKDNGGMFGTIQQPGGIFTNFSMGSGGGIYVTDSTVTVDNNAIGTNTANAGSGGGMVFKGLLTTAMVTNNEVVSNMTFPGSAIEGGGGIACTINNQGAVQIFNNRVTSNHSNGDGGGIHCYQSSPAITGTATVVASNVADGFGGGINLYNMSSPSIYTTALNANHAAQSGGGISIRIGSNASIRSCVLNNNFANDSGGGIFILDSSPSVSSSRLSMNGLYDSMNLPTNFGGGIAIRSTTVPTAAAPVIFICSFNSNFAHLDGGAIYMSNCAATVNRNTIMGNGVASHAGFPDYTLEGGGIWAQDGSPLIDANHIFANEVGPNGSGVGAGVCLKSLGLGAPAFSNNIVVKNWAHVGQGGGVYASGLANYQLINDTIADNYNGPTQAVPSATNQGNALYNSGCVLSIWNCIVRGDAVQPPIKDDLGGVTTEVMGGTFGSTCNIGPVWPTIGPNPLFVNPGANNYHIMVGSPCIDAGTTPPGLVLAKDFDFQNRPNGMTAVDIGADEFY
jgi:predicted outer membrane repeat protein